MLLAVIPARYRSSRLPGKMLADLGGKPLLQHTYERVRQAVERVCIATDHEDIAAAARGFGAEVYMTDPELPSGTDRCAAVLARLHAQGQPIRWVINVQGDEPFIRPEQIQELIDCLCDPNAPADIATLARRIQDPQELADPNAVKVALNADGTARYFSRHPIPYRRDLPPERWLEGEAAYYRHIGLYGFGAERLLQLAALPPGYLERMEMLEQLRWLEQGIPIAVALTEYESLGVDTPEDLERARLLLSK